MLLLALHVISITLDGTGLIERVHFRREDDDDSYWRGALECYRHGRFMHVARQAGPLEERAPAQPAAHVGMWAECLHWLKAATLLLMVDGTQGIEQWTEAGPGAVEENRSQETMTN